MALARHRKVKSSKFCSKSPGRASHTYIVIYMLLLAVELCRGGEHASDSLIESMSMSIQNCEEIGSTPGF